MSAGRWIAAGWAFGLVASSCATPAFQCTDNASCGAGACEASGYCSFPDDQCDSGRRYGDNAPVSFAGICVPVEDDTGGMLSSSGAPPAVTDESGDPVQDGTSSSDSTTGSPPSTSTSPGGGSSSDTAPCPSYFPDADQDGFGGEPAVESCDGAPPGHTDTPGDCDDDDPRIHPDGLGCPNPDSMVGWWRFESQAMGSVPNEIAGNGDATLVGDAALSASGAPFGDSLFLAQPDDAADLSAAAGAFAADGTMPESGTVEAWVRPDTPVCGMAQSCAPMIVYFGEAPPSGDGFGSEAETHIMMNETVDGFVWAAFMNSAEETCFVSGTPAVLDDWAHVALSWGPTQCSLYVDGGLVASQVKGALNPGVVSVQLGRPNAPDLRIYQGDIDEVMFFNEERTAAEIGEDCGCSP